MSDYTSPEESAHEPIDTPPTRHEPIRVLVVDDQYAFTDMLRVVLDLESDITVVGTAVTGAEGLQMALDTHPDVALVDYHMPGLSGLDVIRGLRKAHEDAKVIVLTGDTDEAVMAGAIAEGAVGYITKHQAIREVVDAVRKASEGEPVIPPFMIPRILSHFHNQQQLESEAQALREKLSSREIEILEQLARGADNKAIGDALVISPHTVRTHVQNVLTKMKVHSKLEATTLALKVGLISLPKNDT
jgi:two-component system NarL family response regulator